MKVSLSMFVTLGVVFSALTSCEEDDEKKITLLPNTIYFSNTTVFLPENASTQEVRFQLIDAADVHGLIILEVDTNFSNIFTTIPAVINNTITLKIEKGVEIINLALTPIDNDLVEAEKTSSISIKQVSAPFIIGENRTLNLTRTDDDIQKTSSINFTGDAVTLDELSETGVEFVIQLSQPAAISSEIKIDIESLDALYDQDFVTQPALNENQELIVFVSAGASEVSFKLIPKKNLKITGELAIQFTIAETTGLLVKGTHLSKGATIKDAELKNLPKGYTITNGTDTHKKTYVYDVLGRISKVHSESYTPFKQESTDTYFYNAQGQLDKKNLYLGTDIVYIWSKGKVVKTEKITSGIVKEYSIFEYNELGKISGTVTYHRQSNGEYLKGMSLVCLYFNNGNIYKTLLYQDSNNPNEPILLSTKTYEQYSTEDNLFPMVEILPTVKLQHNLPGSYTVSENGTDLQYMLRYEFNENGFPTKRIAESSAGSQTALYYYY